MTSTFWKAGRFAAACALALAGVVARAAPAYTLVNMGGSIPAKHLFSFHYNDAGQWSWSTESHRGDLAYFMTAGGRRVQLRDQGNGLFAYGMNNKGAVVGQDLTPSGWLPFVWEPGKGVHTLVGGPGAGLAINDAGWVTGEMDAVGLSHAFVAQPGAPMQDIQTLDVAGSQGEDIDAFGNVAGTATVLGDYTQRAFVYTQGTGMQLLPLPAGATASWGQALNDSGAVIGTFKVGFDMHAFLWNGSTMLDLGTLPGDAAASFPVDINNSGWVVGYSYLADDSAVQGWLWTPQDGMVSLASLLPAAQQNCRIYGPSNIDSHGDIPVLADCGSGYFIGLMTPAG